MEVRMKLKIFAEGMGRGDKGRKKMSFFRPRKYDFAGGSKKAVK
jgi:hypothetical protein